ncbi:MAG: outer membrane lipoprotein-sorting protein [Alphaproteobacteria bacterium]
MFKKILILFNLFTFSFANAETGIDLLKKMDNKFHPHKNSMIKLSIKQYKNDKLTKINDYTVYNQDGDVLVLMKSGSSKGNRLLLIKRGMYLASKKSNRPVRITPIQRLMGNASYGDLTNFKFADDYSVVSEKNDNGYIVMTLKSVKKKNTYDKLVLWVKDDAPHKMDVYLKSGKLFKKLKYNTTGNNIKSIEFRKPNSKNTKTVIKIHSTKPKKLKKRLLTPKGMKGNIN